MEDCLECLPDDDGRHGRQGAVGGGAEDKHEAQPPIGLEMRKEPAPRATAVGRVALGQCKFGRALSGEGDGAHSIYTGGLGYHREL